MFMEKTNGVVDKFAGTLPRKKREATTMKLLETQWHSALFILSLTRQTLSLIFDLIVHCPQQKTQLQPTCHVCSSQ